MIDAKTGRSFRSISGVRLMSRAEAFYWRNIDRIAIRLDAYIRRNRPVSVRGRFAAVPVGNVWRWDDTGGIFSWIWKRK